MSDAVYSYLVADTLTGDVVADVPLTGVSFDRRISRAGMFRGKMDVNTRADASLVKEIALGTGRYNMWIYRGARLWWGGLIWTVSPTQGARGGDAVNIQGSTYESYANRRFIWSDLNYTNLDQVDLILELWRHMQARGTGSDLGVQSSPRNRAVGPIRSLTVGGTEGKKYGGVIEDIGDLEDGPEFTMDVMDTKGVRTNFLRIGTPTLYTGREIATVSGSQMPKYTQTVDATSSGTHFRVKGDTLPDTDDPVTSNIQVASASIAAGFPRTDIEVDFDSTDVAELDARARAERSRRSGFSMSESFEIYLNEDDDWHPNYIGDNVRIMRSKNDLWMDKSFVTVRPAVLSVTPSDRGKPESIKITIDEDAE